MLLRFCTGVALAGVYPVGMKIMATWTRADRGLGIGLLVAALTIGSAAPHLLTLLGGGDAWRTVLLAAAALAALGALVAALRVTEGPYKAAAPRFDWRAVGAVLRDRSIALANLGYLGHMWELYAMRSWILLFLLGSFTTVGVAPGWAALASFAVVADSAQFSASVSELHDSRYTGTALTLQTSLGFLLTLGTIWLVPTLVSRVG